MRKGGLFQLIVNTMGEFPPSVTSRVQRVREEVERALVKQTDDLDITVGDAGLYQFSRSYMEMPEQYFVRIVAEGAQDAQGDFLLMVTARVNEALARHGRRGSDPLLLLWRVLDESDQAERGGVDDSGIPMEVDAAGVELPGRRPPSAWQGRGLG